MTHRAKAALFATLLPLQAAANPSVWSTDTGPALRYRYIETNPILRLTLQNENAETYAPDSLFARLYPSIEAQTTVDEETNGAIVVSKQRDMTQNQPRGILSSSYVQEFAYIDTYSNIRKYENHFSFPSIRMSLAMPWFGNGFGGGYQSLQFGFGPNVFNVW